MTDERRHPGGTARLGDRRVARIGYGAMQLERLTDAGDRDRAIDLIRYAIDLGVDHIDTAEFYAGGAVNALLGAALRPGDDVAIVSKVGAVHDGARTPISLAPAQKPHELRAQVEQNLASLGVESLAVVNLRRVDGGAGIRAEGDQIVDLDDQLAELAALRDEGKIGGIGLSNVGIEQLRQALPVGIVCVQNIYNLLTRQHESELELCAAEGIAWVPFFPLGSGRPGAAKVTDRPEVVAVAERMRATPSQVGLAWLLTHSPNTLLIPGTTSPEHLEQNLAAGALELDARSIAELDAVAA